MFTPIKVAAISFRPVKFDVEANVKQLHKMFRQAGRRGAQLALAPEGAVEGYVVNEILADRSLAHSMRDVAISMRGPVMRGFCDLAEELNMCLAFGFAEQISDNVFNSAVYIDNNGRICGKYHKMQLAEGYHRSWWFNRLGQQSRSIKTPFGKCGFMICNDRWNPDLARIAVLDGARYLLIPSYGNRTAMQDKAVLARARENGVPIVEANVGLTLIISKGEILERSRKVETITYGVIDIPAAPSAGNRDDQEKVFLRRRRTHMKEKYERSTRKIWEKA